MANSIVFCQLDDLPVISIPTAAIIDEPSLVRAQLRYDGTIQRSIDGACVGQLEKTITECFSRLVEQENIQIQLMVKALSILDGRRKGQRVVAHVAAILYGQEELADCVGSFLDDVRLYLQDPFLCEQNVPYKNPHCLPSMLEELRMTFDLPEPGAVAVAALSMPEHLKALETANDFPEWAQKPSGLRGHVELQK